MCHRLLTGIFATTALCALSIVVRADGGRLRAIIAGSELPVARVEAVVVDGDIAGVDAATVTLDLGKARTPVVGDPLSVDAVDNGPAATIFKGEIVGVEPGFDFVGRSTVILRAFNRLHRLTRGRKSRTFEKKSDAEIARAIATEAGLEFGPSGPEAGVGHDHVFQHNQTDLEFLRERAARIGYEVLVDDTTLLFRRPIDPTPVALGCAPTRGISRALLNAFHPRLASANQVSKVTVRGWDPKKQEEIVATATRRLIPLSPGAADVTNPPGTLLDLGFIQALETAGASYGAAFGTLVALTAEDLSGEADADGSAALRAGALVSIAQVSERFDGKYYVVGVKHRYTPQSNGGAYHTLLRLARADRALFVLPEIGDEVLVAFEHGDISHPVVVGSLWNDQQDNSAPPVCDSRPRRP